MSQLVRVSGDYGIKVDTGSVITLDTGPILGKVIITGDLLVQGGTTTIQTVNLAVSDNIVFLNVGETGPGVTKDTSGIEIDRGRNEDSSKVPNVRLFFDERISWYNPLTDSIEAGSWIFEDEFFNLRPLRVAALSSSALGDFTIDLRDGPGVLRLVNSDAQAYSDNILDDLPSSDNKIPTTRTLRDYVTAGLVTPGVADVDKIYFSNDGGLTIASRVQSYSSNIDFYINEFLEAQITAGGLDLYSDLNVRGSNLTTTSSIFNLLNTNATTVNFAGFADTIVIGSSLGSTRFKHSVDVDGNINIDGGNLTVTAGTFNLANTNALTVNFAGTATLIEIGSANGTTNINHNLVVDLDLAVNGGDLTTNKTTFNLVNGTATTVNFAGAATTLEIGAATGTTNINNNLDVDGDVNIDGGDLTTSATTFNLANANATTVNFAGAATNIQIGASTGTTNVNNDLDVDGDVNIDGGDLTVSASTFNLANANATTVNFAGAATTLEIGAATGTTNINNNLDVDGDVNIDGGDLTVSAATFNLANTTATIVNFAGAATNIQIGSSTGTTNVNNDLDVDGDVNIDGNDLTTSATTFNLLNGNATTVNFAGAATTIEIGSSIGTTNINNDLDVDGDVNIDGGDLTVSTATFNLANTNATTVNFAGAATTLEIGAATGTTNINNNLDVDGDVNIDGGDLTTSATTFNLLNTTATTINFAGDATTIEIGTSTGSTTINDINITGNVISSVSADDLFFDGVLALSTQISVPAVEAGYVKLYSVDTPGTGGTGLYFVNTIGTNDELISKTKALLYSLIL